MAWFNLLGMAVKTGAHIYSDRQKTKQAMSDAQLMHAQKMAAGQEAYQGKTATGKVIWNESDMLGEKSYKGMLHALNAVAPTATPFRIEVDAEGTQFVPKDFTTAAAINDKCDSDLKITHISSVIFTSKLSIGIKFLDCLELFMRERGIIVIPFTSFKIVKVVLKSSQTI